MRCLFWTLACEPDFADSQLTAAQTVGNTTSISDLHSVFPTSPT